MLQSHTAAPVPRSIPPPSSIQFYSIELAPCADGRMFVRVQATICEREGELENMDIASDRVGTIDDALAAIRGALILSIPS